jgi:hypothetical protein
MPVLALLVVLATVAAGACAILILVRRLRTPRELRGDWWSEFEREFRAYASQAGDPNRERRRRHRGERA